MRGDWQSLLRVSIVSLGGSLLLAITAADGHEQFLPPMPSPARPPGPTLATVSGVPVTLRDYDDVATSLPHHQRTPEQILRKAVHYELLRQEGIRLGFDKDPALRELLEQLRGKYAKYQLVQREADRQSRIPEAELRQYYDAHKEAFGLQPFEEVKGRIQEEVTQERLKKRFEELYAEAGRKGFVEYKEEAIKELMTPPPNNPSSDVVLAMVDGTPITVHDFGHVFLSLDRAGREAAGKDPKPIIRALIQEELRRQEGLRLGLDQDPAFAQYLERHTREHLVRKAMRPVLAKAPKVTEEVMWQYYEGHKDEFTDPEMVSVSHILLGSREAAEAVLAELKAGADFATLARERSEDPATRDKGGRLSPIRRWQKTPEFERAAFALKPGELSGVVEDTAGFHIVKLHRRYPAGLKPFDAIKGWLHQRLLLQARETALEQYLADLEKQATIKIDEEALEKIRVAGQH